MTISDEKKRLLKEYAKKNCGIDDAWSCKQDRCLCGMMAEFRAILNIVIPDGFRHFTFKHFDGLDNDGNVILEPEVAKDARAGVSEYCWGSRDASRILNLSAEQRFRNSILGRRLRDGSNVVIHGDPLRKEKDQTAGNIEELPRGRTFTASIIMREAINLRAKKEFRQCSYHWVEFSALCNYLFKDKDEAIECQSVDWLVVDDISPQIFYSSYSYKSYIQGMLDPFFFYRINRKLPTILVFKFDIGKYRSDISDVLGTAISKILKKDDTFFIKLAG